ncbi:MAG: apolipoprotein N-acyltransferase [Ignavibacteria bacterium]|nr:apolipoprotein N-acyltransferase [Ignavibacteria bacterium]
MNASRIQGDQSWKMLVRFTTGLAILSGLLLGAAFPPSPLYFLAYVALIPFLILLERLETYRQVLFYTYLMALAFHLVTLYWVGGFTHRRDPYLMVMGTALVLFHPTFYWLITIVYFFLQKHAGVTAGRVAFPFLWTSYDYLHSLSDFSPWISIGNSQAYNLYGIQIAEYTSTYGPGLFVLIINVLLSVLLAPFFRNTRSLFSRNSLVVATVVVLFYVGPLFYGIIAVKDRGIPPSRDRLRVAIIQPNIDPWEKWGYRTLKWKSFQDQLSLLLNESKEVAARNPELIVWPETAIPYEIFSSRHFVDSLTLRKELDSICVAVFTGMPAVESFDSAHSPVSAVGTSHANTFFEYYNAATLIVPHQPLGQIYKKVVLVPFAERVPYAETFPFLVDVFKWNVGTGALNKGQNQIVFQLPLRSGENAQFSGVICFESVYPNFVRTFVDRGAQLLLVITNDSWWGNTSGAYQHAAYASFRAIENRRWIVRCANGGISSFVDPTGIVRESTKMYLQTSLVSDLNLSNERTFYARHGDLFAQLCVLCSASIFVIVMAGKLLRKRT